MSSPIIETTMCIPASDLDWRGDSDDIVLVYCAATLAVLGTSSTFAVQREFEFAGCVFRAREPKRGSSWCVLDFVRGSFWCVLDFMRELPGEVT